MNKNPCIGCDLELADKNNDTCRECDKRVAYVESIGDMTCSVPLEGENVGQSKPVKICVIDGCEEEVYCRDLCHNDYQKWYKGFIKHPIYGAYKVWQPKKNKILKPSSDGGREGRSEGEQVSQPEPVKICVICHDPDKKIENKLTQTCSACYQAYRKGTKDHPTLGKFVPSEVHCKSRIPRSIKEGEKVEGKEDQKVRKEAGKKAETVSGKVECPRMDGIIVVNLDDCPKIDYQINYLADKYFVPRKHVIIGLLGEALAARREKKERERHDLH